DLVDFDSVRAGLKEDIKAMFNKSAVHDLKDNPFSAIGLALAGAIIDPVVDTLVNPSTIVQIVSQGEIESKAATNKTESRGAQNEQRRATPAGSSSPVIVKQGYDGYSRYRITIRPASSTPDDATGLTLRREGFFTWRLSRVHLPKSLFENLKDQMTGEQTQAAAAPAQSAPSAVSSEETDVDNSPQDGKVGKDTFTENHDYQDYMTYTNGRFDFKIDYPRSFAIKEKTSNKKDDVITMVSSDGKSELIIAGGYSQCAPIKDWFDTAIKKDAIGIIWPEDIAGRPKVEPEYKELKDNWFAISWRDGRNIIYCKTFVNDSTCTDSSFTFVYPENQRAKYDKEVLHLDKSFKPGGY
ncbi:MAG: DUF2939 domain-containing protein, partial [Syntrophorhabdales bacterium]